MFTAGCIKQVLVNLLYNDFGNCAETPLAVTDKSCLWRIMETKMINGWVQNMIKLVLGSIVVLIYGIPVVSALKVLMINSQKWIGRDNRDLNWSGRGLHTDPL